MKKSLLLLAAAMIGGILFTACDKEKEHEFPHFEYDKSLAGSVSCSGFPIKDIKGSYDGVFFEESYPLYNSLYIDKISDSEISLMCKVKLKEVPFMISVPVIPLSGKSYDVTFDHLASEVTVEYNQKKRTGINASVKGWIKNVAFSETRTTPVIPDIRCEITIECEIDGKKLILNFSMSFD